MTIDRYDPLVEPDAAGWLALDEDARLRLVEKWHAAFDPRVPNIQMHAAMHAVVENQAAAGDAMPVQAKLRQLVEQGLDRHAAIHAVISVLMQHITTLMTQGGAGKGRGGDPNAAYFSALARLDARKWQRRG